MSALPAGGRALQQSAWSLIEAMMWMSGADNVEVTCVAAAQGSVEWALWPVDKIWGASVCVADEYVTSNCHCGRSGGSRSAAAATKRWLSLSSTEQTQPENQWLRLEMEDRWCECPDHLRKALLGALRSGTLTATLNAKAVGRDKWLSETPDKLLSFSNANVSVPATDCRSIWKAGWRLQKARSATRIDDTELLGLLQAGQYPSSAKAFSALRDKLGSRAPTKQQVEAMIKLVPGRKVGRRPG
ncbi:MAG: hypothetical protein OSB00_19955 [Sphingomonas bacterium]|nr:hypothetical protein [Sphingomonas bacterium]